MVARGFAREREEAILGEGGIAAAIFARSGEPVGAIGIAGPRARILRGGREPELATHVIEAARGVSRDLGAPRWPARILTPCDAAASGGVSTV